jgi:uncharacterized protein YegJ (DUF2314 family)
MRILIIIGLVASLFLSACDDVKRRGPASEAADVTPASARPDITPVASADPEMNAAKEEARRTLGTFLKAHESGGNVRGLLKVYFAEPGGPSEGEHMWVEPTNLSGPKFKGTLLSTPEWIKSVKAGAEVTFTKADVSDWLLVRDGKATGAYTVRLLRKRMSEQERREHDAGYPFSFD